MLMRRFLPPSNPASNRNASLVMRLTSCQPGHHCVTLGSQFALGTPLLHLVVVITLAALLKLKQEVELPGLKKK